MKHLGNFTSEGDVYGGVFQLEDGTIANVVTIFTGSGLSADTEIEAERPLTDEEQAALLDADAMIDHAEEPQVEYSPMTTRGRF